MANDEGVLGGECGPGRVDRRLEERALRERWPLTPEKRARIMERLYGVVDDPEVGPRHLIGAATALISADRLNLERARFEHETAPVEAPADDYEVDIAPRTLPRHADRPPG